MNNFKDYIELKVRQHLIKDTLVAPKNLVVRANDFTKLLLNNAPIEDILYHTCDIKALDKDTLRKFCQAEQISKGGLLDLINDLVFKVIYGEVKNAIHSEKNNKMFLELKKRINNEDYLYWKTVICKLFNIKEYWLLILNEDNLNELNTLVLENNLDTEVNMKTKRMDIFKDNVNVSDRTFGIDLGTTNSAISVVASGNTPEIIRLRNGKTTMPSCVTWLGEDNFLVGQESYVQRYLPNTIYSVKRIMGSNQKVTLENNGETKEFTPEEISAEILKGLCREVEDTYGKVKNVVITVPAYFNNNQVEATRKAGELAGLNVLSTFREPTSAGLVYSVVRDKADEERILVYDLGGGTFDVSLVVTKRVESYPELDEIYGFDSEDVEGEQSAGIVLDVLRKNGDMFLGGDDIDEELVKIFIKKLKEKGIDGDKLTKATRELVKLKLEGFKKEGVAHYTSITDLEFVDGTVMKDVEVLISVGDFAEATRKIYNRTKIITDEVLEGMNIDSIVTVGGSTKSELIKEFLRRDYPNVKLNDALQPDESVALGAALQAKRIMHGDKRIKVFDILPLSIGVLANNRIQKMLHKDQTVPFSVTRRFTTTSDNQERISIDIYQGNSNIAEECTYLGKLTMDDIPKKPAGVPTIYTTLAVNADGVLKCRVSIEGKVKEVELVNILKGNKEENLSPLDERKRKKLVRWRRVAQSSENKDYLLEILDKFEKGEVDEKEVLKALSK